MWFSPSLPLVFANPFAFEHESRHETRHTVSKDLKKRLEKKRKGKKKSRNTSSSIIFSPRVRNSFSFSFSFHPRPVSLKLYLSLLSISFSLFPDREENGRRRDVGAKRLQKRRTNELKKKEKRTTRRGPFQRSNKTEPSIHGWKPVEKSSPSSPLPPSTNARRCRCVLYATGNEQRTNERLEAWPSVRNVARSITDNRIK